MREYPARRHTVASMAERAGFGFEESLGHHFRRFAATTPGAYRRRRAVPVL